MTALHGYFEQMYGAAADPYGVRTRWYEQRKRSIVLASLPARRFQRCYEPGCGGAELTMALAQRCDSVLAADFSETALQGARQRTAGLANVQLARHVLPGDWPEARGFDLVVLSEVLYFLPVDAVRAVAQRCAGSLLPHGVVVACDWRPDFAERCTATADVHAALAAMGLPLAVSHDEADFSLKVWTGDGRSVAQREGIR